MFTDEKYLGVNWPIDWMWPICICNWRGKKIQHVQKPIFILVMGLFNNILHLGINLSFYMHPLYRNVLNWSSSNRAVPFKHTVQSF